jgi:hypothetical protein
MDPLDRPTYVKVDGIRIFDGTTPRSSAYRLGRIAIMEQRIEEMREEKKEIIEFEEMIPSTLTAQGLFKGVNFVDRELIPLLHEPTGDIRLIGCNFGELFNQAHLRYLENLEVPVKSNRGRKKREKVLKRKMQGNGRYFQSQITFVIWHPEIKREYKIKLFHNGVFQVPGIQRPDMTDLIYPIRKLEEYIRPYFEPGRLQYLGPKRASELPHNKEKEKEKAAKGKKKTVRKTILKKKVKTKAKMIEDFSSEEDEPRKQKVEIEKLKKRKVKTVSPEESEDEVEKPKKRKRKVKTAPPEESEDEVEKPKKRKRKVKSAGQDEPEDEVEKPKRRKRKVKPAPPEESEDEVEKPKRRKRKVKTAPPEESDDEAEKPKRRKRKVKTVVQEDEPEGEVEKTKKRKRKVKTASPEESDNEVEKPKRRKRETITPTDEKPRKRKAKTAPPEESEDEIEKSKKRKRKVKPASPEESNNKVEKRKAKPASSNNEAKTAPPEHKDPPPTVKAFQFNAVMRNYKTRLVNYNYHIDLNRLERFIHLEKGDPEGNFVATLAIKKIKCQKARDLIHEYIGPHHNYMGIAEITYNNDRCLCLTIKFHRPAPKNPKKKVTLKLLRRGKINFDGGSSELEIKELFVWVKYIYNKYSQVLEDTTNIRNVYHSDTSDCSDDSIYDSDIADFTERELKQIGITTSNPLVLDK